MTENSDISATDEVFARGLAEAEASVAMIGLQLIALGGLPPPVPEKATEFGRFVAVELAKAHVAGSTVQIAEFTDRERQRVAEMLELAARSRQETADLARLTEETRLDTQRSAKILDDLFSRIARLEETAKATRGLAQDLLAEYLRLAGASVDPDLVRRASTLGFDLFRREAP